MPPRGIFSFELLESRPGIVILQVAGPGVEEAFKNEPGGHRWQRVPATERHGRVQTSTITVACLPEPTQIDLVLLDRDLEWNTMRGSGPGGQHRNKTESAVQLRHRPSGVMVRVESERSQMQNKKAALELLRARLWAERADNEARLRAADRKAMCGTAMRGDKVRTIRVRDNQVTDHRTGRRWRYEDYVKGDF